MFFELLPDRLRIDNSDVVRIFAKHQASERVAVTEIDRVGNRAYSVGLIVNNGRDIAVIWQLAGQFEFLVIAAISLRKAICVLFDHVGG